MRTGEVVLGRWRVLAPLGSGGMGEVHLVEDLTSRARYALKSVSFADPEGLLRFGREAEALARVDRHPHLVRVHAREQGPDGRWHLLMEQLPGGSLAERIGREGRLTPQAVQGLGVALASALGHCHAQGVLHRDVKPGNVLFDGTGSPRLVDLGLARLEGASRLTETGVLLGTPATMAPEQVSGDPRAVGPWTDVYGLGATLYWAATGQPPFEGRGALEVLRRVATERPAPPSARVKGFPAALEAVILRAMERDPRARWPSMQAFGEALAGDVAGARVRGWRGLAALGSLALGGAAVWAASATPKPEPPAVAPAESPAAPSPSQPSVAELLETEDGAGALAALESRWAAGERGDVAREAACALLVLPDDAARERWSARQGEVADPRARAALQAVCAGLRGDTPRGEPALGLLFAAERALFAATGSVALHTVPPAEREGRIAGLVQALWEAGLAARKRLNAPAPEVWVRWRLFTATPRLTPLAEGQHPAAFHWLGRAATGEGPSARAMRLAQDWLERASSRPTASDRPPPEDWAALPPPGRELARVLHALASLREPLARAGGAAESLRRWRELRAALVAWRGDAVLAELEEGRGDDLLGLSPALGDALRRVGDACVHQAWQDERAPAEAEEVLRLLFAEKPSQKAIRRAALAMIEGRPGEAREAVLAFGLSGDGGEGVRLCRVEAALAGGDLAEALEVLGASETWQPGAVAQAGRCLRALALAELARVAPGPVADAQARRARDELRDAPSAEPVGFLPWRTPAETLTALEALERRTWYPGQPDAQGRRRPYPPR